ncbi:DUF418 domain-containing protein [Herbiconiux sp.]|uniref:DUF418 domain-containing protein n=1 Tax=Herbiconiux sp. TaxID=1871186 RepID=UPI0025C6F9AA|nr:DUF418 domain-containing protein [Herbiconiux sp.]
MRAIQAHRIPAIDIARGWAVLTMFIAHTQPDDEGGFFGRLLAVAGGGERPRTLFAITGGIALGLFVASRLREGQLLGEVRRTVAIRGIFLVALGLFLQTMSSGVSIVLDTWGLLFLIALPFLVTKSRALLIGAAVLLVIGSAIRVAVSGRASAFVLEHTELAQLSDWFTTGSYPLLIWAAFLAVGFAVSRLDLTTRRSQLIITGSGAVLTIAVVAALVSDGDAPLTFPQELLRHIAAIGAALLVVGVLLLLTSGRNALARVLGIVLWPLRAVGSMPLTVYTAHVLALTVWYSSDAPGYGTWEPFVVLTLCSLVFATVWRLTMGQGPLERLIALVSRPPRFRVNPGGPA